MKTIHYIAIIILILFIWLMRESCNRAKINKLENDKWKAETQIKYDTAFIKEVLDNPVYVPQPYAVYKDTGRNVYIKGENINTVIERINPADTAAILSDYYAKVLYKDSIKVKYGTVYIDDTISRNRISARKVSTDFELPVITKTITHERKRRVVSIGMDVYGTPKDEINAVGLSLMYTDKNHFSVQGGAQYGNFYYSTGVKTKLNYSIGVKWPIRIRK